LHNLRLIPLDERHVICRLNARAWSPSVPARATLYSVTRTDDEVSIVCSETEAPDDARVDGYWRAFKIDGPIPFSMVGVLHSVLKPLAEAHVSIFAISTFDTDYVLVKEEQWLVALQVLRHHHQILEAA